jgi:hypothetical protein
MVVNFILNFHLHMSKIYTFKIFEAIIKSGVNFDEIDWAGYEEMCGKHSKMIEDYDTSHYTDDIFAPDYDYNATRKRPFHFLKEEKERLESQLPGKIWDYSDDDDPDEESIITLSSIYLYKSPYDNGTVKYLRSERSHFHFEIMKFDNDEYVINSSDYDDLDIKPRYFICDSLTGVIVCIKSLLPEGCIKPKD